LCVTGLFWQRVSELLRYWLYEQPVQFFRDIMFGNEVKLNTGDLQP